jgi:hypothetical protein
MLCLVSLISDILLNILSKLIRMPTNGLNCPAINPRSTHYYNIISDIKIKIYWCFERMYLRIIFMKVPSSGVEFLLITRSCTANDVQQTTPNAYNKQRGRPNCGKKTRWMETRMKKYKIAVQKLLVLAKSSKVCNQLEHSEQTKLGIAWKWCLRNVTCTSFPQHPFSKNIKNVLSFML